MLLPHGAAAMTIKTVAKLQSDGRMIGDTTVDATGPFAVDLRNFAIDIQSTGSEKVARELLRSRGYIGNGKFELSPPFDLGPHYTLQSHFEINPRMDLLSGRSFYLIDGLFVVPRPGAMLIGPIEVATLPPAEPTPCYGGAQMEELSLQLPDGKTLREVPKGTEIKNEFFTYKSDWSVADRTVTVRRAFSSMVRDPVCVGSLRTDAATALSQIRADYNVAISLNGQ